MDYETRFADVRTSMERLASVEGSPISRDRDPHFWVDLDRIGQVSRNGLTDQVDWLVGLTQIDEFGEFGRDLLLSMAAIVALSTMPDEALGAVTVLLDSLTPETSQTRRIGMIKILEPIPGAEAQALLERFETDTHPGVRKEAVWVLRNRVPG